MPIDGTGTDQLANAILQGHRPGVGQLVGGQAEYDLAGPLQPAQAGRVGLDGQLFQLAVEIFLGVMDAHGLGEQHLGQHRLSARHAENP
jgi:hypothetical protein